MPVQEQTTYTAWRRAITVALIDDEPLSRGALAHALSGNVFELVGEAATAERALQLVGDLRPDVFLVDIHLPSGLRVIEQLALLAPASKALILTRTEENRVIEAILAGARGYILKSAPLEAIVAAVRATAVGEAVLL